MQLADFECPNCGANEMAQGDNQQLICVFCATSFGEITRICAKCGHYNEAGALHCAQCGAQTVRDCPACGKDNWILADHCVRCGRNLDLIERMAQRWHQTTQQRLEERKEGIAELKEMEEKASQQRMAALLEAERIRQEALTLARELRKKRDRQMFIMMGVSVLAFIIVVLLTLLLTFGGG